MSLKLEINENRELISDLREVHYEACSCCDSRNSVKYEIEKIIDKYFENLDEPVST